MGNLNQVEIVKLRTKTATGEVIVDSLSLIAGLGIEGDKKAKGGDRQLCIADEDSLATYREDNIGLCVKRFMPNVTTRNIDYSNLHTGTQIDLGGAIIEISGHSKKCFPECPLVQEGKTCQIHKNSAFAKIITSGTIYAKK